VEAAAEVMILDVGEAAAPLFPLRHEASFDRALEEFLTVILRDGDRVRRFGGEIVIASNPFLMPSATGNQQRAFRVNSTTAP
jgi:hypothetical protein